jgi:DNA helicase-2/ATP-dependent DNA helicase PcrA
VPPVPLDPDQRAAVDHREGPCLVLAGPGSGKTRVIVERFLALDGEGVAPEQQLVLTYTVKAAGEMRERAEAAHGPFRGEVPLSNFHSFGRRVLRQWGWLIGVPPTFHIADAAERWLHLDAVLTQLQPRSLWNPLRPHDLISALLALIEDAKQELITPDDYGAWCERRRPTVADPVEAALLERHAECAAVYAALLERYRRAAVLDYDDCILLAEQLIREHPAARAAVCDPLAFVMVDEYQDTNYAQARLVEALAPHRNLLVVADDDQAIYKFRGASLANLNRFQRLYPDTRTVVLGRNYRSTRQIVATGQGLIAEAAPETRVTKQLASTRGDGLPVELWQAADERSEVMAVARECRRLIDANTPATGIAWLFRRHVDMRAAMAALQEVGVPYQVHGGGGYFQQPEIKRLLALLTAVHDPGDSQSVLRCLTLPAWRVSNRGRLALVEACRGHDVALHALLLDGVISDLDEADEAVARRCAGDLLELHGRSLDEDVRSLLHDAVSASGFLGILEFDRDLERIQAGANLNKFYELLDAFADWGTDLRLGPALHYLEILRDSGTADDVAAIDPVEDSVSLLTAHSAKGLEWPVVIIAGCVDSRWPGRGGFPARLGLPDDLVPEPPPPGDGVVDEERRLFYVAATRARDRLILCAATRYPRSYADERLSPFLAHAGRDGAPQPVSVPYAPPALQPRPRPAAGLVRERVPVGVRDLRDFNDCPRRYEYRRRYRIPVQRSPQQLYGELVHGVLEAAAMMRLAGGDAGAEEVAALWRSSWAAAHGPKGAQPQLREYGEQQLRRYAQSDAWREATIVEVERDFTLPLDAADLRGRFDRIDAAGGGARVVVDYKTGPVRDVDSVARDLQVRAYAVALAQREATDEVAVEVHHLQTGEVARVDFDAARLRRAFGHLSARTAELAAAWRERSFPPRPAAHRCRGCDFRIVCDEGREAL